jgi:hypothetical protein
LAARAGGKPPRGALLALAVLLAAGVVFLARRERSAGVTARPIGADAAVGAQAPTPPASAAAIPDLPRTPSSAVTRAAIEELAASPDLRAAVSSENTGTSNGRLLAATLLQHAEESVVRVHDLIVQSTTLAHAASDSGPVRDDVRAATDRTLMLAGRLRDSRLQAISTSRRMLSFMEENAGGYEVRDGAVRFTHVSDQVQFSHFQVSTARVLGEELLLRSETSDALAEQEQLLARGGIP